MAGHAPRPFAGGSANRIERIRASGSFYETHATFLFHGWVPESELARLEKAIAETFGTS